MVSPENTNWLYDYGFEDFSFSDGFCWPIQSSNDGSLNISGGIDGTNGESSPRKERARKGVLEMNHVLHQARKHTERNNVEIGLMTSLSNWPLGKLLEPRRLPKTDKLVILADAVIIMVTQLQGEAQKLKELNLNLQDKIKELKDEKNELRNEKQILKLEKEKIEQPIKMCAPQPGFLPAPPSIPAAFAARSQASTARMVRLISYPGVAMWQLMPPAVVDTSRDHLLRPPFA